MSPDQQRIRHFYNRAAFGADIDTWERVKDQPLKKVIHQLFKDSQSFERLSVNSDERLQGKMYAETKEERMMRNRMNRSTIKNLNVAWFRRMASSPAQLREKMTLFWHDHFACRVNFYKLVELQHNTLRQHALGHFGDLLLAVAKDPAMLQFLNNQQNKKAAPNENFARELLELFTLGRGHYTEQDIKEAARAFTGWGFNMQGEFVFRRRQHDEGQKTFMGQTGNWDGEDIIRMVLAQKQTAHYLTTKLYQYFVHDEVDGKMVDKWAAYFYQEKYHIGRLLERIFTSEHFYKARNVGTRIKSPAEYLVGIMRHLRLDLVKEEGFLYMQRVLGQVLFEPPNVAGWPQGKAWIDSNTLLARLKIPQALIFSEELDIDTKEAFAGAEDLFATQKRLRKKIATTIDWQPLEAQLDQASSFTEAVSWLGEFLMAREVPFLDAEALTPYIRAEVSELLTRQLCARLMSTPEYQFC